MLQGIRLKANLTEQQKLILSQWMGCARFIWNAKCDEDRYFRTYARKYCPTGTYPPVDQKTSHFKSRELSPWLSHCPSQIIRNSAVNWYQTCQKFMKGICGRPGRKPKTHKGSVHITKELFRFDVCKDGVTRLFIGTKTNNIGYLSIKNHRSFSQPKSLYIRKEAGSYYVSFCYDDDSYEPATDKDNRVWLKGASKEWLDEYVIGVDRGVVIPAHTGVKAYDFTINQKSTMDKRKRYIKKLQRRLSRQTKGSSRRQKTKNRITRQHRKVACIRQDFCHKTSRTMVNSKARVIIFENLKTSRMTRKPKARKDRNGKFIPNNAKAKAGLNKAVVNVGWHYLETCTRYKAAKAGKAVFKVPASYTSQECADCGHTHPDNRRKQETFACGNCGHVDNADKNASIVIKKRAINLLLDSGTELAGKGIPVLVKGRGAIREPRKAKAYPVVRNETSKKKRTVSPSVAA